MRQLQSAIAIFCAAVMAVPPGYAQQSVDVRETPPRLGTQSTSWHSRFSGRYLPPEIEPIDLRNSTRLDHLVRAGRIYLSLQDAIALALENNLDIELQRYGPRIAESDLLRAQAGGLLRGVPQAIQAAPQSALNLQTGGLGTGAGGQGGGGISGAGSSSGTIITAVGANLPNYDEVMFVSYNWGHRTVPNANSIATGVPALVFNGNQFNWGIQKGFATGTTVTLGYGSSGTESNNRRAEINPVSSGNANVEIRQRLLQGFGLAVNTRNIRIAKNDLRISDLVFRQQVMQTVSGVVNLYSDLVSFNQNVKVKQQALALAEKLYNDNKKQVEIGTLAPIEIVRAEAEVARSQQELTAAETQLLQQETIIKNALSRTGVSNPLIAEARIVPTDLLRMPDVEQVEPIQDLVSRALENRPEIEQTQINIDNAKISLAGTRSQLLPSLDLVATAQNNGLAGTLNPNLQPINLGGGTTFNPASSPLVGDYGSMFSQIFRRAYPDYALGFQLSIPIRNRAAQADVIRDQLSLRQSEIQQRKQVNQVRVDVQNALIGLQQARAQFQAAQKSRILQEQTLDAEQKKYALGASTIFFVIQAQRDLAQALGQEVQALSAYNRARVSLDLATGQTLKAYDISVDEAMKGKISRPPTAIPELEPQGAGPAAPPAAPQGGM